MRIFNIFKSQLQFALNEIWLNEKVGFCCARQDKTYANNFNTMKIFLRLNSVKVLKQFKYSIPFYCEFFYSHCFMLYPFGGSWNLLGILSPDNNYDCWLHQDYLFPREVIKHRTDPRALRSFIFYILETGTF